MQTLRETAHKQLIEIEGPAVDSRADLVRIEAEKIIDTLIKAFGNCEKCYGKGYGTETLFTGNSRYLKKEPTMKFCTCPRGVALRDLIEAELV